jgi:molybdenum cofactor biosynthesis enzyme MoaA
MQRKMADAPKNSRAGIRDNDFFELPLHFRCNLRCQHCMILESIHWLEPADKTALAALATNRKKAS